jgi:hypothetical protein
MVFRFERHPVCYSLEMANLIETDDFRICNLEISDRSFKVREDQTKYQARQCVSRKDRKIVASLFNESHVLRLEFCSMINDRSYFYLIGMLNLTESQILQLCDHFEKSMQFSDDLSNFQTTRVNFSDSEDDEFVEESKS